MAKPVRMRNLCRCLAWAATCTLVGCSVGSRREGPQHHVDIESPFGSVQVKTDSDANASVTGMTPYPGSVPVKDRNNTNADVNVTFGNFHLGVRAASFLTRDGRDQVLAFYQKDLKRFGDVIECQGSTPVGKPVRTAQGLTCSENHGAQHGSVEIGTGLELRTGSPQRQHIVAIDPKDGGIKIGLVALDLPSGLHGHGSSEIE